MRRFRGSWPQILGGKPIPAISSSSRNCLEYPSRRLIWAVEERHRLIREAGWAIRAVHEIGIPGFGLLEESTYLRTAQVQGEYDSWGEFLNQVLDLTLPVLRAGGVIDDAEVDRVDQAVADHADYLELGPVGHLLHGKFDPAHVLVDDGRDHRHRRFR